MEPVTLAVRRRFGRVCFWIYMDGTGARTDIRSGNVTIAVVGYATMRKTLTFASVRFL
jgi:hypothetical protein